MLLAMSSAATGSAAGMQMNEYQGDDAALRRLLLLAQQGDADAQFELGRSYTIGRGVAEDDQEAVFWYRKAAEQGHVGGQFGLGLSFAIGVGVPADDREATSWFRKAAEQGDASAQLELGRSYSNGKGVPEDDRESRVLVS